MRHCLNCVADDCCCGFSSEPYLHQKQSLLSLAILRWCWAFNLLSLWPWLITRRFSCNFDIDSFLLLSLRYYTTLLTEIRGPCSKNLSSEELYSGLSFRTFLPIYWTPSGRIGWELSLSSPHRVLFSSAHLDSISLHSQWPKGRDISFSVQEVYIVAFHRRDVLHRTIIPRVYTTFWSPKAILTGYGDSA